MITESDPDMETESGSEEWPLKLKNQARKRKSSRKSRNSSRRNSVSPPDSHQRRHRISPSVLQQLGESLKKKPKFSVTCGSKEGVLHKDRFNKSQQCILSDGRWFTPTQFEKFGGKEKNKKWKHSILCNQIPLQTLIWGGILAFPTFNPKRSQDKKPACRKEPIQNRRITRHGKNSHTSESVSTSDSSSESDHIADNADDSNDDDDDDDDEVRLTERAFRGDSFEVECSTGRGVLHVNRFATETCGKCIRTQDAWLTPRDFLKQNTPNGNWRRDITRNGVPLGMLILDSVLRPHAVNCKCGICTGERLHLVDQNNDDVCFKCNRYGDLVCCDKCPRAFHHHCHKPTLTDDTGNHWTCSFCKSSVQAARKKSS